MRKTPPESSSFSPKEISMVLQEVAGGAEPADADKVRRLVESIENMDSRINDLEGELDHYRNLYQSNYEGIRQDFEADRQMLESQLQVLREQNQLLQQGHPAPFDLSQQLPASVPYNQYVQELEEAKRATLESAKSAIDDLKEELEHQASKFKEESVNLIRDNAQLKE